MHCLQILKIIPMGLVWSCWPIWDMTEEALELIVNASSILLRWRDNLIRQNWAIQKLERVPNLQRQESKIMVVMVMESSRHEEMSTSREELNLVLLIKVWNHFCQGIDECIFVFILEEMGTRRRIVGIYIQSFDTSRIKSSCKYIFRSCERNLQQKQKKTIFLMK